MPSALSVVRGNECKIVVNEKNAVLFCGSDARFLAVGNYSCCTEHTLHRDRSCAHSNIYSCDYTEYWERRLMLFPESQWVTFKFRRNPQVMIDFIGCCIGCVSPISSCRSRLRLAAAGLSSSPHLSGHSNTQTRSRAWSVESAILITEQCCFD